MIVSYDAPAPADFISRYNRGVATIIVTLNDCGGGGYGFGDMSRVDVKTVDWMDVDDGEETIPEWVTQTPYAGERDGMWYLLTGNVLALRELFHNLANELDPEQDNEPSGDDDVYDYYPAAFECLCEFADDLDELDKRLVIATTAKPRLFTAHGRIVSLVTRLQESMGPFEEWEFEDYAAPYLTESESD